MYLSHILKSEEILSPEKHANTEIAKPIADSRKIEKNDVFFCEDGFYESGFSYAARAVDAGAALIVTEKGGKSRLSALPIPVLEVENVRKSYARAWSRYENEPQNALRLLAVTGPNGNLTKRRDPDRAHRHGGIFRRRRPISLGLYHTASRRALPSFF